MKIFIKFFCLISLLVLFFQRSNAQTPDSNVKLPYIIEDGDTIPVVQLHMATIIDSLDPDYYKKLQAYYRLRFNVMKVYPYAKLLAVKLNEINTHMSTLQTKKERKEYLKEAEA